MSEKTEALNLAERLLNEPNADPDDDLRVLSRQLLRKAELVDRLQKDLGERCDGTLDMIHANRDSILAMHENAIRRIRGCLKRIEADKTGMRFPTEHQCDLIGKIIDALNVFHPMYGESWPGWPQGSEP